MNVVTTKKTVLSLYTLLMACMGAATVLEKIHGKEYAADSVYGSWWFAGLWGVLVLLSVCVLVRKKVYRRLPVMLLHLSFAVILAGALVTHLMSKEGTIHLREYSPETFFRDNDGYQHQLPFALELKKFVVSHYPGTDAVMDYTADISLYKADEPVGRMNVSMNNIGRYDGYRFYQSSYDRDEEGTVLLVTYDPYGIALTYFGYLLLFVSLMAVLFGRQTRISQLYRAATKPLACLMLLFFVSATARAATKVTPINADIAGKMGQVAVLYNGRICPLDTPANEFVTKLCGKSTWNGLSADEIFLGWMIYYTEWEQQPIIKVKSEAVQRILGIDSQWACVRDFYNPDNSYKLKDLANDMHLSDAVRKAVRETDEKIQVITMFYNSEMLHLFPLADKGRLQWYTPGSTELPLGTPEAEFQFINHAMDYLVKCILANDVSGAEEIINKIKLYQKEKAGDVLPSSMRLKAEVAYNCMQSARWVVFLCLTLSIVFCFLSFRPRQSRWQNRLHLCFILLQGGFLTVLLALRWWVSGHIPVSNGFETMLFMAWVTVAVTLAMMRTMPVLKAFAPVMSSLCMLVAMLAVGSPQITQLMPVLQSPLLSVHVALVMMAYSLFGIMTLLAARCLWLCRSGASGEQESLTALSRLLLYPAVSLLALGIFVGAVWANVSWGSYWSWDPKETWALITMMVYAIPLHRLLESPKAYHLYILLAFMTILMTYFGVNWFLTGMHSYA